MLIWNRNVTGVALAAVITMALTGALWLGWDSDLARPGPEEFDRTPANPFADDVATDGAPSPPRRESLPRDRKPVSAVTPTLAEPTPPTDESADEVAKQQAVDREQALAMLAKRPDIVDATHRRASLLDPAILMHSDELNPRRLLLPPPEIQAIATRVRGHRERYAASLEQYRSVADDELDMLIERGLAKSGPPGSATSAHSGWQRQTIDPADPTKPLLYHAPGSMMPRTGSFHAAALAAWAMGWDVLLVEFEKAGLLLPGESDSLRARVSGLVDSIMMSYQR